MKRCAIVLIVLLMGCYRCFDGKGNYFEPFTDIERRRWTPKKFDRLAPGRGTLVYKYFIERSRYGRLRSVEEALQVLRRVDENAKRAERVKEVARRQKESEKQAQLEKEKRIREAEVRRQKEEEEKEERIREGEARKRKPFRYDFRKACWGMSKEQVEVAEGREKGGGVGGANSLFVLCELGKYSGSAKYAFVNDKLVSAKYEVSFTFLLGSVDATLRAFEEILQGLERKYGRCGYDKAYNTWVSAREDWPSIEEPKKLLREVSFKTGRTSILATLSYGGWGAEVRIQYRDVQFTERTEKEAQEAADRKKLEEGL